MLSLYVTARSYIGVALENLRTRLAEERGQDLLEYALLGGMVAVGILAAMVIFTPALNAMATGIKNCIDFTDTTVCDPGP